MLKKLSFNILSFLIFILLIYLTIWSNTPLLDKVPVINKTLIVQIF